MAMCIRVLLLLYHIGLVVRISILDTKGRRFEPQHQYVFSLSKRFYPHCFSRLSCEMSTRWGQPREGVQCYELFGGIALKNHAFSFSFFISITFNSTITVSMKTYTLS